MKAKLSNKDKLEIISSTESTRSMGEKYGVHHSVISDLRTEARELMITHWEAKSKRHGRPRKEVKSQEEKAREKKLLHFEIKQDWLELCLRHACEERDDALQYVKASDKSKLKKKL
jgi:hypothetical protein